MQHIAYVDDNLQFWDCIKRKIPAALHNGEKIEVDFYQNPLALLEAVKEEADRYSACFLDIEMPQMSGIDLARTLRCLNGSLLLVLISAYDRYAYQGYRIDVFDYLLKEEVLNGKEPSEAFWRRLEEKMEKAQRSFCWLETEEGRVKVQSRDVYYMQRIGKRVECVLAEKTVTVKATLKEMQEMFGERDFLRVERGYLVNCHRILRIGEREIETEMGHIVPVGRRLGRAALETLKSNRLRVYRENM